jgi:cytochrome c oxidase subunit 2
VNPQLGPNNVPSALMPVGPAAVEIATLWWVMALTAAAILTGVTLLALWYLTPLRRPRWLVGRGLVIGGGIALPIVLLSALLLWSLPVGQRLAAAAPDALRVEVSGRMWWWEVRYLDAGGRIDFVTANELKLPVGRPVDLALESIDVIHSFWVPQLAGKTDLIPGRTNRMTVQADQAGIYRGQCAEFCGLQHAWMAFWVEGLQPEAFDAWLETQRQPAPAPATPKLQQGRDLFSRSGCGACHRLRGVPDAEGRLGPDLTHVGGRISLAAGLLPNSVGSLAGWIASAQHLKPGNAMPSYATFTGEELRALAAYLESLQ